MGSSRSQSGACVATNRAKRQSPALAGRKPSARPIRHRDRARRRPAPPRARVAPRGFAAAQRSPEDQRFARRQARLDAVLMADIVQRAAMTGDIGSIGVAPQERSAGRRRRSGRRAAATGSSCRCRSLRSAPGRRRPAGGTRARRRRAARRAGTRGPRRSDRQRAPSPRSSSYMYRPVHAKIDVEFLSCRGVTPVWRRL